MKKILIIFLLMSVSTIRAQQVSVGEAMSRAKAFLKTNARHNAPARDDAATTAFSLAYTSQSTTDTGKVCYYIFNCNAADGFIIVGGDEAAEEILGYCDHGTFDYATAPDNFKWWLSQYQQQISASIDRAEANPQAASAAKAPRKTAAARSSVAPLIQTQWNQCAPYSDALNADFHSQCPELAEYNLATGCVATAMAQVMKYYAYPTQGVGSHSKSTTYKNKYTFVQQADFGNTTYDWDNMATTYSSTSTDAQKAAVATLMYHAGVSVDMMYLITGDGSGACMADAVTALINYFKYDKDIRYDQRDYLTDNECEEMIYSEIAAHRPVIYGGGVSKSGGHTFICDGYDAEAAANKFHINWGWSGSSDGWYAISGAHALTPTDDGIGAPFNVDQEMITGIRPDAGGAGQLHLVAFDKGTFKLTVGGEEKSSYDLVKSSVGSSPVQAVLSAEVQSISPVTIDFNLGVRAYDRNTGKTHIWSTPDTHDGLAYYDYSPMSVSIDLNELQHNGTYELQTIYRPAGSSDDDWQLLTTLIDDHLPTVIVTGGTADGEAASINDRDHLNANTDVQVYNLQGQRLAAPQKGTIIINGKKVMVK